MRAGSGDIVRAGEGVRRWLDLNNGWPNAETREDRRVTAPARCAACMRAKNKKQRISPKSSDLVRPSPASPCSILFFFSPAARLDDAADGRGRGRGSGRGSGPPTCRAPAKYEARRGPLLFVFFGKKICCWCLACTRTQPEKATNGRSSIDLPTRLTPTHTPFFCFSSPRSKKRVKPQPKSNYAATRSTPTHIYKWPPTLTSSTTHTHHVPSLPRASSMGIPVDSHARKDKARASQPPKAKPAGKSTHHTYIYTC